MSQDNSQSAITFFHEEIEEIFNILSHETSLGKAVMTETIGFSRINVTCEKKSNIFLKKIGALPCLRRDDLATL